MTSEQINKFIALVRARAGFWELNQLLEEDAQAAPVVEIACLANPSVPTLVAEISDSEYVNWCLQPISTTVTQVTAPQETLRNVTPERIPLFWKCLLLSVLVLHMSDWIIYEFEWGVYFWNEFVWWLKTCTPSCQR